MLELTSDRERRLWLWLVVVMGTIYTTLGPAQVLAGELRERNLLRLSIGAVVVVVGVLLAVRWARTRPGWREVGAAFGVVLIYAWMLIRVVAAPEERSHMLEYGLVAALIHLALLERGRNGRPVPVPALVAVVATALLGFVDECIQALLPSRVYDIRDVVFNALAGVMVIGGRLVLAFARRWDRGAPRAAP